MIRLDTHIVVWLYSGDTECLTDSAIEAIEHNDIAISPMVELELTYLREIGRLTVGGPEIFDDLAQRIGIRRSSNSLQEVVANAQDLVWTRDPFDRLIVADAAVDGAPLVTADRNIAAHVDTILW